MSGPLTKIVLGGSRGQRVDGHRREPFTLFCGYASGHFGDPRTAAALVDICAAHTHLHRKADDLLAEFLLEQNAALARDGSSSRS